MKGRIFVTGKYVNNHTYVLFREDGSVFKTLREKEPFFVGNQLQKWFPVRIKKKSGKGSILMCRKYDKNGNVKDEFPLLHERSGFWALNSKAASKGVFKINNIPEKKWQQIKLENLLKEMGIRRNILVQAEKIDITLQVGGKLCHHCKSNWGYGIVTDGDEERLSEPEYAKYSVNPYHIGCMVSTYEVRIRNATYLIYFIIGAYKNGIRYRKIIKIITIPDVNYKVLINELRDFHSAF